MSTIREITQTGEANNNGGARRRLREVHFGEHLTARGHCRRSLMTSGPGILWVMIFLLVPLVAIAVISFMTRGEVGAGTTALCVLAALPLAFFIAALPPRFKNTGLTLVLIPFWTNLLIRTYAWQILLAPESWITQAAACLHLVKPGEPLYPSAFAIYAGMVCDYLPFLVLPLYASVEKIDWAIAEAASDLGANAPRVFWHAILPQVTPGLVAGVILVLIPATGQFVIPDLLGGAKTVMIGNVIQQQFGPSRDWPFGSAISCLVMGLVLLSLWAYARSAGEKGEQIL